MKKLGFILTLILGVLLVNANVLAQTNPATQTLPFTLNSQTGTTLPLGVAAHRFGTGAASIPTTRTVMPGNGDIPNTTTSNSGGWSSEGANGISLLASGSQAAGAIVVAIDTTGLQSIQVNWLARTILQQTARDNSIALQYRVGTSGDFINVGTTTIYSSQSQTAGSVSGNLTETLPSDADNKAVVQVRWVYWESNGASGSRDRVGIDDISITGTNDTTPPDTTINLFPSNPTTSTDATFGFSSSESPSTFECSLDGADFTVCSSPANYSMLSVSEHTFQVRAIDQAANTDLTPASYTWTINSASNIDLTISRTGEDIATNVNQDFDYTITVANSGTSTATNVKATFQIPVGLNYVSAVGSGGFTAVESGGIVTFTGGTVGTLSSVDLTVTVNSPTSGFKATSFGTNVTVDPDGVIAETNEANNIAPDNLDLRVQFQSPVEGLAGRSNLATLLSDIAEIGINADNNFENIVRLTGSLEGEDTDITVPNNLIIDFNNFSISGTANITFNEFSGFDTSNVNGLGDLSHPGSIQLTGTRTFDGNISAEYYGVMAMPTLGGLQQTAYGNPSSIRDFTIDNPTGLVIVAPFSVSGSFNMVNGVVNNSDNTITLSSNAQNNGDQSSGGSETSYVSGKFEKELPEWNTGNGIAGFYIFPVGAGTGYSPLRIDYNSIQAESSLTVQVVDNNVAGLSSPSLSRYWQIDETGDANVNLTFNWRNEDDSALNATQDIRVFRNLASACTLGVICSVDLDNNTASIQSVTNFSPWTVAVFSPTAANAEVSGKVTDSRGNAIANARVSIIDQNGAIRSVRTNNFGNYTLDGIESGRAYTFTVESRENTFAPQIVTVQDNINSLNFSAID